MNRSVMAALVAFFVVTGAWLLSGIEENPLFEGESGEDELEAGYKRDHYEWLLARDPRTGKIPEGIRKRELDWAKFTPSRANRNPYALIANAYKSIGPSANGGRTRALAFDVRYNGTSNRIVLAGGINGGIFRSTDGGVTWRYVHPSEEIRQVSCIAQDPRPGFQDTWYAGTGEAIGNSASEGGSFVFGYGMFKSTDNGLTWSKLASTATTGSEFGFDNSFDFVTNVAVHPTTGHVYAAVHNGIARSTDGGTSWAFVLRSTAAAFASAGMGDILINKAGTRLYAAMSGRNPDRAIVGVWTSTTGDNASWTRIAGGVQNAPDSVPGWRAYDNSGPSAGSYTAGWGRIVLGLSGNENDLYCLIGNSQKAADSKPEADLFRANLTASPITWSSNLGVNLVAKQDGTDDEYFQIQGGYDMEIWCHPTQNNIVYAGGVFLIRSTDAFASTTNNLYMGGYASNTYDDPDGISHADIHRIRFDPVSPNRMLVASDGGIAITNDATATKPAWLNGNINYQTFQYYYASLDPTPGSRTLVGGTQDNGFSIRDRSNLFGPNLSDSNDHYVFPFYDGGQTYFFPIAGERFLFTAAQEGRTYRFKFAQNQQLTLITPQNTDQKMFVTYYHIDPDNADYMYFPVNDTLYRTTSSSTVTPSAGWTRLAGVDQTLSGDIYAMATSRGTYSANSMLLIGTDDGKLYRLRDPANTATNTAPQDITPGNMTAGSVVKDIAFNPRNHDTAIVVVSNYNVNSIFWTGNASAANPTWTVIEGNLTLPSVRSCEIVLKNTGVEYYVGTTVGLFATTSVAGSGTFWSKENGGPNGEMNTAIVNSLDYRWRDNVLLVATHGNGLFIADIGGAVTIPTSTNDPIRDDKNFIVKAFPTLTNNVISWQAGNMLNISNIQVQVYNLSGQVLYNQKQAYQSGSVDVGRLPRGTYILAITSPDRKYQFLRRFTKS